MSHSPSRRTRAAVYREAAKLIEDGWQNFACTALRQTSLGDERYCTDMKSIYAPRSQNLAWLCVSDFNRYQRCNFRVLALCFMAAMVEAGDA